MVKELTSHSDYEIVFIKDIFNKFIKGVKSIALIATQ